MAKVLVSFFCGMDYTDRNNDKMIVFYESLCTELQKNGNDVLVYNHAFFNGNNWAHLSPVFAVNKKKIQTEIESFNPDLIISFNNVLPLNIKQYTNCPIIVWAADLPWTWINSNEALNDHTNIFIANSHNIVKHIQALGGKNVHYLPLATSIQAEPLKQTMNISFVGTIFHHEYTNEFIKKNPEYRNASQDILQKFLNENSYDYQSLIKGTALDKKFDNAADLEKYMYSLLDMRISVVAALLEIGINLYGPEWDPFSYERWSHMYVFAYPQKIYTLQQNQDVYNSSKLALNINHPQAGIDGFSWRVYDILASNACLLVQKNTGIQQLLKSYVDIPMFESPSEAFLLAKKLLDSPSWRSDIVAACQQFIAEHGRWHENIKILGELTGVSLLNDKREKNIEFLLANDFKPKWYIFWEKHIDKKKIKKLIKKMIFLDK